MAEDMGMNEGVDFFLIKDNCLTELKPEEYDENGVGRTLTCIGFRPMDSEIIDKIGKKFQLYN
jgi:PTH2 family peptidyl-tRNA hydrolase|uniref:peptidyl-tRNA hydrolase n=1 Tax=virus sp. ctmTa7 TaxID=2828255 RepID=A0A8S5RBT9_9VIRU|nr:MAG TPA: peptidyl-tRNA hydrolase [virus sp. ctmTa7]